MLGVDEAGRGPLAGPLAVGMVLVSQNFVIVREFPGIVDSKQMSPLAREKTFRLLRDYARKGDIQFCARFVGAKRIDEWGLTRAAVSAIARGVHFLTPEPDGVSIFLDGLLKAPDEYAQQTIIGGDEAVPIIALASIVAKVQRDRLMKRLAKQFPEYDFEIHKGYGTKAHYAALKKYGPCELHRQSFLH